MPKHCRYASQRHHPKRGVSRKGTLSTEKRGHCIGPKRNGVPMGECVGIADSAVKKSFREAFYVRECCQKNNALGAQIPSVSSADLLAQKKIGVPALLAGPPMRQSERRFV